MPVERGVVAADQGVLRDPLAGDLAIIVIRSNDIDVLAPVLLDIGHQLLHILRRRRTGAEDVAVANATLILRIVEIKRIETAQNWPNRFAGGGGDAAMHDGRLVLGCRLGGELRVKLYVGLRIIVNQLDLPAKQTTRGIQLINGEVQASDHWLAVNVQTAGRIVDADHLDRICTQRGVPNDGRRRQARASRNHRRSERVAPCYRHPQDPLVARIGKPPTHSLWGHDEPCNRRQTIYPREIDASSPSPVTSVSLRRRLSLISFGSPSPDPLHMAANRSPAA